ncbi:MAG: hypothetical protein HC833_21675 [Leptolyngbyaceae cyanobacterium RM1_406_9]|nr:hypothetical protein [Leptolyngbyaceae cyanobacterium RM1_406_9]
MPHPNSIIWRFVANPIHCFRRRENRFRGWTPHRRASHPDVRLCQNAGLLV